MDGSTMVRVKVAAELAVVSVDPLTLRRAAGEIRIAAALIGVQLTGDVLQQVRTAFGHLAAAASSPGGGQAGELRQARAAAARLITSPDQYAGSGVPGLPSAAEVRALGHLANYYHSLISRLPRQALIDGYQCTEQFPALGVQMLPAEYFSRDYRRLISGPAVPGGPATPAVQAGPAVSAGRRGGRDWRGYALEKAWRVPAAGGILLLGLLSASQGRVVDVAHGGKRAWEILADGDYGLLPARQQAAPGSSLLQLEPQSVDQLLAAVAAESRERCLAVRAARW
jgi:hypothetical protein